MSTCVKKSRPNQRCQWMQVKLEQGLHTGKIGLDLIHYKEHGHTLVCLICICKNFVDRIKKNTAILSLILSLSKPRFFHVIFNKNGHHIYEYVLYCIYVVEIHWHPTANGVEKCTRHVNSRSNMTELIICTCIVLAISPLPRLIYKPCKIATCMKNLSQIN